MKIQRTEYHQHGDAWATDGSPTALIATMFAPTLYTSNYGKRLSRVERLASDIQAEVFYPMTNGDINIRHGELEYNASTLRRAEQVLRWLKSKHTERLEYADGLRGKE